MHITWTFLGLLLTCILHVSTAGTASHRVRRSPIERRGRYNRFEEKTPQGFHYRIGAITDLDQRSRIRGADQWFAFLTTLDLYIRYTPEDAQHANITIRWEERTPEVLQNGVADSGRGQELSELILFKDRLLTCDDRTGIVYQLIRKNATGGVGWKQVPWVILATGDGTEPKGFKCEWATVKDDKLYIGSHGTYRNLQYVKEITEDGRVTSLDWAENYKKLAETVGVHPPGYVTHEAAGWSDYHQKWVFIPRKVSSQSFDEAHDSFRAANLIIFANEDFTEVSARNIGGELKPSHGVSSFKWLPLAGSHDRYIVALKAEEIGDFQSSFILAFDMDGHVLFPETKIEDYKYEGLEFI